MVLELRSLWPEAILKMVSYIFCLASFFAIALGAQQVPLNDPTSSPFTVNFDKLVTQEMHRWHTPGLAIAVIDGQSTFSKVRTELLYEVLLAAQ